MILVGHELKSPNKQYRRGSPSFVSDRELSPRNVPLNPTIDPRIVQTAISTSQSTITCNAPSQFIIHYSTSMHVATTQTSTAS